MLSSGPSVPPYRESGLRPLKFSRCLRENFVSLFVSFSFFQELLCSLITTIYLAINSPGRRMSLTGEEKEELYVLLHLCRLDQAIVC